jgi:glutathione S-transferase
MLKLYGHANRLAANTLKIRAALAEAGAEHAYVVVDLAGGEQKRPEFLALNPHGKVPVLVDDDFVLPESDAILWYVAEKFPAAKLLPGDARGRAIVLRWLDFASASLYPSSYDLTTHTTLAEPDKRSAFVAERARANLDRAIGVLDGHLAKSPWVAGPSLTIADFAVAAVVQMLVTRGQLELSSRPSIAAYFERMTARPAWAKATADAK